MSLNTLRKTRWKIDSRSISVSPYGIFYLLGIFMAAVFILLFFAYTLPPAVIYFLGGVLLVVTLFGSTKVIFDNEQQLMQKKFFGFLSLTTIPFERLDGINIVRNNTGGYNFRAFRKNNKFGKGVAVSSGYGKDTDANALAFVQEVIPVVHGWLDLTEVSQPDVKAASFGSYRFFSQQHQEYIVKKSKISPVIIGIGLVVFAVYAFMHDSVMEDMNEYMRWFIIAAGFLFGLVIIAGAFTKISFDTATRTVRVTSPIGLKSGEYAFDDFDGFQIVRRSTNMIYTGTDVQMYFKATPGKKEKMIGLKTFMGTKKIDQFLAEAKDIMK